MKSPTLGVGVFFWCCFLIHNRLHERLENDIMHKKE